MASSASPSPPPPTITIPCKRNHMLNCLDQHVERANIHLGFSVKQLYEYAMANLSSGIKIDNFGVVVTSNEYKAYTIFTMNDIFTGGGAFIFCILSIQNDWLDEQISLINIVQS